MDTTLAAASTPATLVPDSRHAKLHSVQSLRGLAALVVVFFHLSLNRRVDFPEFVIAISAYGKYGVQAFFVLSGFILPWSMMRSGYRLHDMGVFIIKRLIRLDPPYLISIAISIISLAAAANYGGAPYQFSMMQILAHLGYFIVFSNMVWLNPIYWTLAVEMQFYLVIALFFPIINKPIRILFFISMALSPILIHRDRFLPHHISLFLLGIGIYLFKSKAADRRVAIGWMIASLALMCTQLEMGEVAGGLVGASFLFASHFRSRLLEGLGAISYSLYLVHYHIGNKTQSLLAPHLPWYVTLACGVFTSIGAAYLLYRLVEIPSQRWANALRYRKATLRPDDGKHGSQGGPIVVVETNPQAVVSPPLQFKHTQSLA